MTIFQIILGELPEHLEACVESVIAFSKRCNHKYVQITDTPGWLSWVPDLPEGSSYFKNRLIKDWFALEFLSVEKNALIVDWDIFLNKTFCFNGGDLPVFAGHPIDCMIYNSSNTAAFNRMIELAGRVDKVQPGTLLVANAINKYREEKPDFMFNNFDTKTYKHLDNCRLAQ